ncbi:hypothetical protein B0T26DRAFT_681635 [Lasiosphaeria miniovina]|uniref:Uncharacterized protein n=1 Tax=Lasiosphaeria miniovina TaxID=1954250 RepID=A0AA39ZUW9_9PEZI|nr:uncharacterized protein B0T26DRAFT_681635 [Lasiosphaeria miniovina]KAK0704021.1 hypothetical protein B0T26DRAFT_681635 [Lasiosphaeria miniovina]
MSTKRTLFIDEASETPGKRANVLSAAQAAYMTRRSPQSPKMGGRLEAKDTETTQDIGHVGIEALLEEIEATQLSFQPLDNNEEHEGPEDENIDEAIFLTPQESREVVSSTTTTATARSRKDLGNIASILNHTQRVLDDIFRSLSSPHTPQDQVVNGPEWYTPEHTPNDVFVTPGERKDQSPKALSATKSLQSTIITRHSDIFAVPLPLRPRAAVNDLWTKGTDPAVQSLRSMKDFAQYHSRPKVHFL